MTALRVFASSPLRTNPAFLVFAIGSLLLFELLGAGAPTTYAQTRTLIWSDEFNSATSSNVDTTKWNFDTGNGGWGNNELETYTSKTNNAYVAGGLLHIRAQQEATTPITISSAQIGRSEEHTSELQSLRHLVCRLL